MNQNPPRPSQNFVEAPLVWSMGTLFVVKVATYSRMKICLNISIILFIFKEIRAEREIRNPHCNAAGFFFHVSLSKNQW